MSAINSGNHAFVWSGLLKTKFEDNDYNADLQSDKVKQSEIQKRFIAVIGKEAEMYKLIREKVITPSSAAACLWIHGGWRSVSNIQERLDIAEKEIEELIANLPVEEWNIAKREGKAAIEKWHQYPWYVERSKVLKAARLCWKLPEGYGNVLKALEEIERQNMPTPIEIECEAISSIERINQTPMELDPAEVAFPTPMRL